MPLTNPNKVVTEERLNEYHRTILPYLGGNSMVACGGGYAPIGTVISYMGTRAPSDFLICDGTVYNIADYTELADFFEAQFGSSNFFGGDGNTTFAVPDLRGEFLRGTGTNSHANQGSGANVGVHQDATEIPAFSSSSGAFVAPRDKIINNKDSQFGSSTFAYINVSNGGIDTTYYTSRPTNTSVLYCIKAKSQGNGYSLDEQIVGTWIDGKPIYQKTISIGSLPNNTQKNTAHGISNLNFILEIGGIAIRKGNPSDSFIPIPHSNPGGLQYQIATFADATNIMVVTGNDYTDYNGYITIQYTKTTD